MVSNIACAVDGCREPVTGQCQGYAAPCGRFACAKHTLEGLCPTCATRKVADTIALDYLRAAKEISAEGTAKYILPLVVVTIAGLLGALLLTIPLMQMGSSFLLQCVLVLGTPLGAFLWMWGKKTAYEKELAAAVHLADFPPFYEEWRKKKDRELAGGALLIVSTVAAGMVGTALHEEAKESRRRQEIDQITNEVVRRIQ